VGRAGSPARRAVAVAAVLADGWKVAQRAPGQPLTNFGGVYRAPQHLAPCNALPSTASWAAGRSTRRGLRGNGRVDSAALAL
jgi:hypothetical protein